MTEESVSQEASGSTPYLDFLLGRGEPPQDLQQKMEAKRRADEAKVQAVNAYVREQYRALFNLEADIDPSLVSVTAEQLSGAADKVGALLASIFVQSVTLGDEVTPLRSLEASMEAFGILVDSYMGRYFHHVRHHRELTEVDDPRIFYHLGGRLSEDFPNMPQGWYFWDEAENPNGPFLSREGVGAEFTAYVARLSEETS